MDGLLEVRSHVTRPPACVETPTGTLSVTGDPCLILRDETAVQSGESYWRGLDNGKRVVDLPSLPRLTGVCN